VIKAFFRPFLGGVFLDRSLATSSRMFEFVFRMFASGSVALPAEGMEAIPRQLAQSLPADAIRTGMRVQGVANREVRLENGDAIQAEAVVVATQASAAARLLGESEPPARSSVICLYFAAPRPPLDAPILVLDGEGQGPVNNLAVLSQVAPSYAPPGQSLISATVLENTQRSDPALESAVRRQMHGWFGAQVDQWRLLRVDRIAEPLPDQRPMGLESVEQPICRDDGIYVCGDHRHTASLQGAMVSGRRVAEDIVLRRQTPSRP
jgi:phytoene dehydrogenase-like protein